MANGNSSSCFALRAGNPVLTYRLAESIDVFGLLAWPRRILRSLDQVLLQFCIVWPRLHGRTLLLLDLDLVHEVLVAWKKQS